MHPERNTHLKLKIQADFSFTPQDKQTAIVCHSRVAECFVAYLKRIAVRSALFYTSPTEVDHGLVQMYISLTTNEAEKLCNVFVQELQEKDMETIQEAHRHIFLGARADIFKSVQVIGLKLEKGLDATL
jgi:hypothetical protein